jgi:enoyl-CoA hydratase/carnithine racemase
MDMKDLRSDKHADRPLVVCESIDVDGYSVAIVTFNRPEERNPLDRATLEVLRDLLLELSGDGSTRAIIITGAGPAFSAGGDLKGYQTLYRAPDAFSKFMETFSQVCDLLERGPAVTAAMVNGACVAGGLELALACDFITLARGARIGDGHLRFGQLPGAGGSQRLVRAIGLQRARQWLLTGQLYDAREAIATGLAIQAFPDDELLAGTLAMLRPAVAHSPLALSKMKELIRIAVNTPLVNGLAEEIRVVHDYAITSHDATEGLLAFAERRPPEFRGY